MDRISRALDLSLSQRTPSGGLYADSEAQEQIQYSHTRIMPTSAKVLSRNRILSERSDSAVVDAYRLLRTRVLQRMRQNGWKTLGVTSAGPQEGKTLTSVNLGISIARGMGQNVLVVDADLRHPSLHRAFGIEPKKGIGEYLLDESPLEELLINPGIEGFVMLPGRAKAVSPEHLSTEKMRALAVELGTRYRDRFVIFDLPPVLVGDDVVSFAPYVDATLLVVEEGGTESDQFERTVHLLEGVNVIGTVLNKSEDASRNYYDYY